jgi:hypothetical protein
MKVGIRGYWLSFIFQGSRAKPKKKPTPKGLAYLILVAGARYVNYMQIEIEPFPLVA